MKNDCLPAHSVKKCMLDNENSFACIALQVACQSSGIAKAGPGQERAQPKHHVCAADVMQSCMKRVRG